MIAKRKVVAVIVVLLLLAGCAGKAGVSNPTIEAISFKTITLAFDAYDLGMTTLRTLQRTKVITQAQYTSFKDKYGWPLYQSIKAADDAAQQYAAAPKESKASMEGKLTEALKALADNQGKFVKVVNDAQEGMK